MPFTKFTNLDFDQIKTQIKSYLRANSDFKDFDFDGSNFSALIDTLAYNTYITAFSKHEHYLSNVKDYHWRSNKETPNRIKNYHRIFPYHKNGKGVYNSKSIDILKQENITHLLLKSVGVFLNFYAFVQNRFFYSENPHFTLKNINVEDLVSICFSTSQEELRCYLADSDHSLSSIHLSSCS